MYSEYMDFDSRSKEAFNIAQLGAVLARGQEYLLRLPFDSNGADVLAYNPATLKTRPIQVKARVTISEKYLNRGLFIAFPNWSGETGTRQDWYLLPHDELVGILGAEKLDERDGYSARRLSKKQKADLKNFMIGSIDLKG